jgi:F0F1-type ATP synthase membrane subunit b/b'
LREIAYSGGTLNGKRLANTLAKLGIDISDRTLKRIAANVRQELKREFERIDAHARQEIERINIQTEQRIEGIRTKMAARASLFGKAVPKTRK